MDFKNEIIDLLSKHIELEHEEIDRLIEIPPNSEMGDYAFPCFILAKTFRKAPAAIAEELAEKFEKPDSIEKIENVGPYINFFINKVNLVTSVVSTVLDEGSNYGKSNVGEGKNVVVEFSSPNIAKPFHIGHIRTTVIGSALNNIYKFIGYNTIAINHLGDYGTQFGKLIVAIKAWGDRNIIESNPIPELLKLYIKFHEEVEEKPELEDEARNWFTKLEAGDEEAKDLWQWIRDISLIEFNRVYDMLGIKFDSYAGESFYSDKMQRVLDIMKDKNLLEESEGANIVNLEEHNMPPALITKKDGSTLYITRDIAAALYRKETYDFYQNIYVVASQQNLHFKQWFKIIELMGYDWAKDCVHIPFGMVSLEGGTIATRKGRVVFLEDVLTKAVEKTKEIISDKNPNLEDKEEVAKKVGIGAVVFQELSHNRIKDYVFSWDKVLNFEGETGPYIQYTYARISSIFRKTGYDKLENINYDLLNDDKSIEIATLLSKFGEVVMSSAEKYEPSIISRYIIDLAQGFNRFYHNNPIINDDNRELQDARLAVCKAVKVVIETGMGLLGIECPDRM